MNTDDLDVQLFIIGCAFHISGLILFGTFIGNVMSWTGTFNLIIACVVLHHKRNK